MIDAHNTIVFAPKYNTKRADATGAFQPEARRFMERHGISSDLYHLVDNTGRGNPGGKPGPKDKARMKRQVLEAIDSTLHVNAELRGVAFFCHGYRTGIQFGITNKDVGALASSIASASHPTVRVPLYACDTGRDKDRNRKDDLEAFGGDGGFADSLRDALCVQAARDNVVWAHTTAGHTTRNPHVRVFMGLGSEYGNTGGFYVVARNNRKLWKAWRQALRAKGSTLRYDFPFMEVAEIHRFLSGIVDG